MQIFSRTRYKRKIFKVESFFRILNYRVKYISKYKIVLRILLSKISDFPTRGCP